MSETAPECEFDCEGCGIHVFAVGRFQPTANHMCLQCEWLCEYVPDPVEMQMLRERMGSIDTTRPPPVPRGGFRR
jgi:hypothetical protein